MKTAFVHCLVWIASLIGMLSVTPLFVASPCPADPQVSMLQTKPITIAAASDLRFAMDSLVAVFKKTHPNQKVTVVYGSSGKFFQQIVNGAPFDVFFSADKEYPQQLQDKKLTASPIQLYAIGRLVLWSKKTKPNGMNALLGTSVKKIAIANPDHAPYGKRAKECLIHYNLYEKVKSRLVFGENISQATQYASTGAADMGILALSLALSPELQKQGSYFLIPADSHTPLEQAYVVLKPGSQNPAAQAFASFVSSASAQAVLKEYGFSLPGKR